MKLQGFYGQLQQYALTSQRLHFLVEKDVVRVELCEHPHACSLVSVLPP